MKESKKPRNSISNRETILAVIKCIPRGRVANYGQIAAMAGLPGQARQVGYALAATQDDVPWHRVINAKGEISPRSSQEWEQIQQVLLEKEGIVFTEPGKLDIEAYRWRPAALSLADLGLD